MGLHLYREYVCFYQTFRETTQQTKGSHVEILVNVLSYVRKAFYNAYT